MVAICDANMGLFDSSRKKGKEDAKEPAPCDRMNAFETSGSTSSMGATFEKKGSSREKNGAQRESETRED